LKNNHRRIYEPDYWRHVDGCSKLEENCPEK
jgi:hypothetical protein